MRTFCDVMTVVFLTLGCFVAFSGALGILRMPDFYTRVHAAGKNDSLAQFLFMSALLLQAPWYAGIGGPAAVRLALISVFIFVTAPVATHAITKAAHLDGLKPWTKPDDR